MSLNNPFNKKQLDRFDENTGKVLSIQDNVIIASGLQSAFMGEVVQFQSTYSDLFGQVLNLEKDRVKIVMIKGLESLMKSGDTVYRTYKPVQTKAGLGVLGKLVDPLGMILNQNDYSESQLLLDEAAKVQWVDLEKDAPGVIERNSVKVFCHTGLNTIDCFIPIGCGQRELIIGDNNTGKTSIAITIILNQRQRNQVTNANWREIEELIQFDKSQNFIPCIYVAIGLKRSAVARIKKLLERENAMNYTCIVCTSADDPAALQYLAPYAGCAIGEWFRDNSYHAIIIYDDLSNHAVAYRQMSLLLRRPPGREAYPGDIFYLHSRLLERAAQMNRNLGGGSLTALPIVETKMGDVSAYIPTNIISITDGQIYLDKSLSYKGFRPAVHLGLSVSRVGSAAQIPMMSSLSKRVKVQYALYKTFEGVEKLSKDIDPIVLSYLERGYRYDKLLTQLEDQSLPIYEQLIFFYSILSGFVDNVKREYVDLYFGLIFNPGFLAEAFEEKDYDMYHFIYHKEHFGSFFYSHTFSVFEKDIERWLESYTEFFTEVIQPRLELDKNAAYFSEFKKVIINS